MTYGLFGKFRLSLGHASRDDLVGYLLQAAKLLEQDPGCVHYIVSTSDEPEAVWVSEVWTDEAAHDATLEPEDIQLIQGARPLIAGMSDQTQLTGGDLLTVLVVHPPRRRAAGARSKSAPPRRATPPRSRPGAR